MSGITSGVGIFSGINTGQIIEQLLAIESRPLQFAQRRVAELQLQQTAILDINSRLSALQSAAKTFRTARTFDSAKATSSDDTVLTASAGTNARPGTYTFLVDRLVSSQSLLSRGFADRDRSAVGADAFTFESEKASLDRDTRLADLNGGSGIARGSIVITNRDGDSATVDLSKAATVDEVLEAINSAGISVTASVSGQRFVLTDASGGAGSLTVANGAGFTTADSLGLAGSTAGNTRTGTNVFYLTTGSPISILNDGRGVQINDAVGSGAYDFTIRVAGSPDVRVFLGDEVDSEGDVTRPAAATVGQVIERINEALTDAGLTQVSASLNSDATGLKLTDTSNRAITVLDRGTESGGAADQFTARDLGLAGSATGTLNGQRILAGLNTVLASSLNGGSGLTGDGQLQITSRDGSTFFLTVNTAGTLADVVDAINNATAGKVTAEIDSRGTGLRLRDTTGSTASNLIVTGNGPNNTAEALGIETTSFGVEASVLDSGNLQLAYLGLATRLDDLNNGRGVGSGTFEITDSFGNTESVIIGSGDVTLDDVIDRINSTALAIRARINDSGDGIVIEEDSPTQGGVKISVRDVTGAVADNLNLVGEASGVGAANKIDGTFERSVSFDPDDTLEDVVRKINDAGVGAIATIVSDGSGSTPFRLSLAARDSGSAGRFLIDTGDVDLGLSTLSAGEDARVFFGSADPARALLLTSSTNTLDSVITGVTIDLAKPDDQPVTLTVARDTAAIESAVKSFVDAFNETVKRIDFQTRFDTESGARGPLAGDGTVRQLRQALFSTVIGPGVGLNGAYTRLASAGITIASGGQISLDTDKFRAALEADPEGVKDLFSAFTFTETDEVELDEGVSVSGGDSTRTFSELGIPGRLEELATTYLDAVDGILTRRRTSLDSLIDLQQTRVTDFQDRLTQRRARLEAQFLQMERAIGQLQTQQSALASLG